MNEKWKWEVGKVEIGWGGGPNVFATGLFSLNLHYEEKRV